MFDGVELGEASEHDDGAWLSIIAGPTAQSCEDPCGIGQRTGGVWVLLLSGLAFETSTDPFQGRLVGGIEDIAERTLGFSLALVDELHDLDGGDQNGGDELFERPVLLLAQRFDVKSVPVSKSAPELMRINAKRCGLYQHFIHGLAMHSDRAL